jgi:nucleotide-binding universal stress UspA family protein
MKTIAVATDFSTRSDRALRRAVLLARRFEASIALLHAVDSDQAEALVRVEVEAAGTLLRQLAQSVQEGDRVACTHHVLSGDPFRVIANFATAADLLLIGPPRQQDLRGFFTGTTADRIIGASSRPVLLCNGVPVGDHREILVALDLADGAGDPLLAVRALGLDRESAITALHVFETPADGLMYRASLSDRQVARYLDDEERRAARALRAHLKDSDVGEIRALVRRNESGCARIITETAERIGSDLVVLGTRRRGLAAKLALGGVAEDVLRLVKIDVLAVPPEG